MGVSLKIHVQLTEWKKHDFDSISKWMVMKNAFKRWNKKKLSSVLCGKLNRILRIKPGLTGNIY